LLICSCNAIQRNSSGYGLDVRPGLTVRSSSLASKEIIYLTRSVKRTDIENSLIWESSVFQCNQKLLILHISFRTPGHRGKGEDTERQRPRAEP